jgi:hypothetical protein
MTQQDKGAATGQDTVSVRTWTKAQMKVIRAYDFDESTISERVVDSLVDTHANYGDAGELDAMIADRKEAIDRLERPGIESGPHLNDPEIRAAKKAQMLEYGMTGDEPDLTDDMRAILREKD